MGAGAERWKEAAVSDNPQVRFCEDDIEIAAMVTRCGVVLARPAPPNDITFGVIREAGFDWLIARFWCPGDEGYMAMGMNVEDSKQHMRGFIRLVLGQVSEDAAKLGVDSWAKAELIPMHEQERN